MATDYTVTSNSDSLAATPDDGTLRGAVLAANGNVGDDRVLFAASVTGAINLLDQLHIDDGVQILGPGADKLTLDAGTSETGHRIFYIYNSDSFDFPVTISGLTMTGGSAYGQSYRGVMGGAILDVNSKLTVSDSVITGNGAIFGGGLAEYGYSYDSLGADTRVDHTTFSDNTAGAGGAIFSPAWDGSESTFYASVGTIENSTIVNNTAYEGGGGGILSNGGGTVASTTITGNHSAIDTPGNLSGGGINNKYEGAFVLDNSIVSGNDQVDSGPKSAGSRASTRAAGDPDDLSGSFNAGFTLIGVDDGGVTETVPGSNLYGNNPGLGPLQINGGTTPTMQPALSSVVVDKGKTPAGESDDQRHLPRPVNLPTIPNSAATGADGADMGAVELQTDGSGAAGQQCPSISASANNFHPRRPKAPFELGVRTRLTSSVPASLQVTGSITWTKHGKTHVTTLGTHAANIKNFRKLRFPVPGSLKGVLEHGDRVRLHLHVVATPKKSCVGHIVFDKTLKTKVIWIQSALAVR
jgi:predicted outer membrane repeat protein